MKEEVPERKTELISGTEAIYGQNPLLFWLV